MFETKQLTDRDQWEGRTIKKMLWLKEDKVGIVFTDGNFSLVTSDTLEDGETEVLLDSPMSLHHKWQMGIIPDSSYHAIVDNRKRAEEEEIETEEREELARLISKYPDDRALEVHGEGHIDSVYVEDW